MKMNRILLVVTFLLCGAYAFAEDTPPPPPVLPVETVEKVIHPYDNGEFEWPIVPWFESRIYRLSCTPKAPWRFLPPSRGIGTSHDPWIAMPDSPGLVVFTKTLTLFDRYEVIFDGHMTVPGDKPAPPPPWNIKGKIDIEDYPVWLTFEGTTCTVCEEKQCSADKHGSDKVKPTSPDSLPSLGERVELHMISGDGSPAMSWGTHIGFGPQRPLNYLSKLLLSEDKLKLKMFIPERQGTVIFHRTVVNKYVLAPDQLALGQGSKIALQNGGTRAVLEYPDGRKWEYEFEVNTDGNEKIYRIAKRVTDAGFETTVAYNAGNVTITDASGHPYVCAFDGQNRITGITVQGRTWSYAYAPALGKVTETAPDGSSIAVAVNDKGQITAIEKNGGAAGGVQNEIREYDADNRMVKLIHGTVETSVVESEDGDGNTKRIQQSGDVTRTFRVSPTGLVGHAYGPGEQFKSSLTRNSMFQVTSRTDALGNKWIYSRDQNGFVEREEAPDGAVTRYKYDAGYNLVRKTTPNGSVWKYEYFNTPDRRYSQLKKEIHPDGGVVEYVRDVNTGLTTRIIDALGNFTDFTHNASGQVLTEVGPYEPAGPVPPARKMKYDNWGNLLEKTDENGNSWKYEYDNMNRLVKRICPKGFAEHFKYDGLGRKVEYTDRIGAFTKWTFDDRGMCVKIEGGMGGAASGCGSCGGGSARGDYKYDNARQLVKFTDLNTHSTRHEYNNAGRKTRTIDARNYETGFAYNARGDLIAVTDANLNTSTMKYDSVGRLTESADALGNRTVYKYNLEGQQVRVTDAAGGTRKRAYDSMGRVIRITDPLENKTRFFYDKNSNQIRTRNAIGVITKRVFNPDGQVVKTVSDVGGIAAVTRSRYDPAGRLVESIDSLNNITKYEYNEADLLIKVTSPLGKETTFSYDKMGRRISVTDGAGRRVDTVYSSEGWVKKTFNGVTTTRFDYDPVGNRIKLRVSGRAAVHSTYDSANNLISTQQGDITTSRVLDGAGRVLTATDGEGKVSSFEYDAANRLIMSTNPLGESTKHKYDPVGRRTGTTLANGSVRTFKYNLAGQLTESDGGPSGRTVYSYDALGRQTSTTDANGRIRTTIYDNLNRVTQAKNEMDQPVTYTYDNAGRRLSLLDAENNRTRYAYNSDSQLISMIYPGGDEERYFYDDGGLLKRKRTANGDKIKYSYDPAGALASIRFGGKTVHYARDAAGAVTEIAGPTTTMKHIYNSLGFMTSVMDTALNQGIAYSYDNRGLRTSMQAAGSTVKYRYDDAMRLIRVRKDSEPDAVYKYDAGGRRVSLKLPNGVKTSYTYTTKDQLKKLVTKKADGTVIAGFNYHLDAVGNRTGIDMPSGDKLRYEFDNAYRLTKETRTGSLGGVTHEESFEYDAVGNRTSQVKNGVTTTSKYNANNQLTESTTAGVTTKYFYDSNGNNIRKVTPGDGVVKMAYDELNRMTEWRKAGPGGPQVEKTVYRGAEWHRAGLVSNGVATAFLYDGDNVVADMKAVGTSLAVSRTYVTPFLDQNISMTEVAGGQSYYYTQDGLGSVRTVTNGAGAVVNSYGYTAFGESYGTPVEGIGNRYQYTGREKNAISGTQYNRYRHYSAGIGRWGRRDPIGYMGGINLYGYVGNRSNRSKDPYGLAWIWDEDWLEIYRFDLEHTLTGETKWVKGPKQSRAILECTCCENDKCYYPVITGHEEQLYAQYLSKLFGYEERYIILSFIGNVGDVATVVGATSWGLTAASLKTGVVFIPVYGQITTATLTTISSVATVVGGVAWVADKVAGKYATGETRRFLKEAENTWKPVVASPFIETRKIYFKVTGKNETDCGSGVRISDCSIEALTKCVAGFTGFTPERVE